MDQDGGLVLQVACEFRARNRRKGLRRLPFLAKIPLIFRHSVKNFHAFSPLKRGFFEKIGKNL